MTRIGYDFLIFDPKELYTSGVYLIEIENEDGNKDTFKKELYKFYKQMCPNSDDIPNDTQHTMKLLKRVEDPEESELINSLAIYCYKFLDKITDSDIQARINQTCHASPERIEKMKKDEEMKEVLHGYTVDSTGCNLITQHELIKIVKKDKAAETIFWRLDNLMNSAISPKSILDCDDKNILRCGVSKAKVSYLNFLAIHFSENPSFIRSLIMMNEQEAYMELTALKGIGPWSAEIFLLFYLNKINVFPKGDATLLKAMRLLYGVTSDKKCEKVHKLVNSWSPYKGVAAIYLWNWVDNGMPALSTK